ncbi:hypothetical protein SULI_00635 [Saccharolobus solfataricus]|uniref:Uncharacterized protein n=3 Tax=Saccharolobus solfataricus TaxID=2287 RepID=Q97WB3_SACS2|nr:hypothetical protein [Saccharolobus solfataricus]AAK42475.1 Hypothetical protein SSO2322 [Saccharolobus solfataricus P2]AKA72575.1 hypothetical protein SULB_0127 [Saccharolobus solfataricus]AKA75274.1 hypothetical protein SULC_0126 [Saccharolobus solfataricus]AKA77967.1 hypothetical protein SULA_0126 [Saccharolobus solfataricus]AZF67085.1 hypothetical protein SULG_00635 [Saccharolobus solfataricus]
MININLPELQQLVESPLFILLISISIPLAAFFISFFKIVLPRITRPKNIQTTQTASTTQNQQQQGVTSNSTKEIEELLKNLIGRMDKYQNDLVNVLNTSIEDLKQTLQKLNSSIEDAVLSLKSAQADSSSPFNIISEQSKGEQRPEGSKELKAVAEIVGTSNIDLSVFIRNCVLLEILDYEDSKLTALYELGYISADDMFIVNKIQSYIRTNNGKIRAKDLANIAMSVAESYSSVTAEMKKYLLVLEVGKNG